MFSPSLVFKANPELFDTFSMLVLVEKLALTGALIALAIFLHERTLADVWAHAGEKDIASTFFEAVLPLHA
jgi:hypothetical protein